MRIVSLCPSLTELVCSLGLGKSLVGVTRYCVHPQDDVKNIEKVGGTKNPDVERILSIAPDLVLMNREENRREDHAELERGGVRCLVTFPRDPESAAQTVRLVGRALRRTAEAEGIARGIEQRLRETRDRAASRRLVRFAVLVWRRPYVVVSTPTYTSSLFECAGGRNAFAGADSPYAAITGADIARERPEVVVLPSEPFPFELRHASELLAETGLDERTFVLADGEPLTWHGVRTPDGLDLADRILARAAALGGPR